MLYLNEKDLFDRKYEHHELVNLLEMHFQYQVGTKDDFKNITSAKNTFSNSIKSLDHNAFSDKLEKLLVDYKKVMTPLLK